MSNDVIEEKNTLRQRLLKERAQISSARRAVCSDQAITKLISSELWQGSACIAIYLPLKSELDVSVLWQRETVGEKALVAPRVLSNGKMTFHLMDENTSLESGLGGISQPLAKADSVETRDIDLFLVPLLGCDRQGNRLGFGKGCYDQTLVEACGFKLGVGFALQLQNQVPADDHDIPMDGFLSEAGLIRFSR